MAFVCLRSILDQFRTTVTRLYSIEQIDLQSRKAQP
jgi:hypothetical protein